MTIQNKIESRLSEFQVAIFRSRAYQKWTRDLIDLKQQFPSRFEEVFGIRKNNEIEEVIVKVILEEESIMIKKVFDKNGDLKVNFAKDSTEQIKLWLDKVPYAEAIIYAQEVDDVVYGKALCFPCKAIPSI